MTYRCPLCLKILDSEQKLIRYCYGCDEVAEIICDENLGENYTCRNRRCRSAGKVREGVYLAHQGCRLEHSGEANNPFWSADKIEVPKNLDGTQITIAFEFGERTFSHWQIGLLGKTGKSAPPDGANSSLQINASQVKEMWFPSLMLKNLAIEDEDYNDKVKGKLVALAGISGAGKTILALQALDKQGYIPPRSNERIEIEDFVYSFPKTDVAVQPIFELLYMRSLMQKNIPFPVPSLTIRASSNLYTVFFKVNKKASETEETETQVEVVANEKNGTRWERLKKSVKEIFQFLFTSQSPDEKYEKYVLALYDVAGEDYQRRVDLVQDLEQKTDKVAFVVDANYLINEARNEERLSECLECITTLKNANKPFCIILSKIDLLVQHIRKENPALLVGIEANREEFFAGSQENIKKFLTEWRDFCLRDSAHHSFNLENLFDELISLDSDSPIFLLETRNLPAPEEKEIKVQPVSYGIDTFVCWCLEIEREEIIRKREREIIRPR